MRSSDAEAVVDLFFSSFETIVTSEEDMVTSIGTEISIPVFSEALIRHLLEIVQARFQSERPLIHVPAPVYVVGDVHGNLQDLVRIFRDCGLESRYLFLGDYVDRGSFSLECILFLFALHCKYPDRFSLIRGNHECYGIASAYGFKKNVTASFPESLFDAFIDVFNWMPVAAIVGRSIFCVHGGIGPELQRISQIEQLQRPLRADGTDDPIVGSLLWADPNPKIPMYGHSDRGNFIEFGPLALQKFLAGNNLTMLLRGHQCVDGVEFMRPKGMPLVTVFSSSSYLGPNSNRCGVLYVDEHCQCLKRIWEVAVQPMSRQQASFAYEGRTQMGRPADVGIRLALSASNICFRGPLDLLQSPSMLGSQLRLAGRTQIKLCKPRIRGQSLKTLAMLGLQPLTVKAALDENECPSDANRM
jgi:protein phosphatase